MRVSRNLFERRKKVVRTLLFSPDLLGQLMYQLGESYERLMLHSGGGDAAAVCERRIACDAAKLDDGGRTNKDVTRVRSLLR